MLICIIYYLVLMEQTKQFKLELMLCSSILVTKVAVT